MRSNMYVKIKKARDYSKIECSRKRYLINNLSSKNIIIITYYEFFTRGKKNGQE